ncbi:hypothetical protein G7046_g5837 [Stylonectria norvegica]|nr:hypothetical protein G7046_g5837 [Stylonectria norvegica]
MVVLKTQSEFGHAPPPQTPYSIISNLPGWEVAQAVRNGDMTPFAKIVHIYPRFAPTHYVKELGAEVAKKVGLEGMGVMVYLNPVVWPYTRRHITLEGRGPHRLEAGAVTLKCVDVAGHRVYAVLYEPKNTPGMMLSWGAPGLGISIRGGEELLKGIESMEEVTIQDDDDPPPPTWTPEGPAHQGLRERITELLHRAAIDPDKVKSRPEDVYLYPTGMAAIFQANNLLLQYRPGTAVVLGIVFHNTYHHLIEECPNGMKHFGRVDEDGIDVFEAWLDEEAAAGRSVSYAFVEIPGNPTLDTPDLKRLKKLSEKHNFVFIVDETVSSFANVDVLPQADLLLTSLTKSFSGLANAMGGSIVLNPLSPHYATLTPLFHTLHHNEVFAADAAVLLANSQEYLVRTQILNRNAAAMANFLHAAPPTQPRPFTPELPNPGYGCLLTVVFDELDAAVAFYDRCGFYPSPHLGGHVTLMFPYNMFVFGKKPEERAYMRELGAPEESVRLSAGLEDEGDLIDTLRDALEAAVEVKKNRGVVVEDK